MNGALQVFSGKDKKCKDVFKKKNYRDLYEKKMLKNVIEPALKALQENVSKLLYCIM